MSILKSSILLPATSITPSNRHVFISRTGSGSSVRARQNKYISSRLPPASLTAAQGTPSFDPRMRRVSNMIRDPAGPINFGDYPGEVAQLPVDHFNESDTRTYGNRFWVNATYYQQGGPVFLYLGGEVDAQFYLARRFNGVAIIFENRYYGGVSSGSDANGSYPVPVDSDGFATDYTYLTLEQVLEDAVYFANNFQPQGLDQYWSDLSPSETPWVTFGGSYPGVLSAILRVRNPETFYAAFASSAPTQALLDFWTYFSPIERSMTRNCSTDYTAITNWVDDVLTNGTAEEISDLKLDLYTAAFSGPGWNNPAQPNRTLSDQWQNSDVANYLTTPLNYFQEYGFERSVQKFCDDMQTMNQSSVSTTDNGGTAPPIASEAGIARTQNITVAWNAFLVAMSATGYNNLPGSGLVEPSSGISWTWQYCTEFGYYQTGNPANPHTIESRFTSLDSIQSTYCEGTFPNMSLPATPNTDAVNKYGGWNMNPSNTMFTAGEFDPWRPLSVLSEDTENGAPGRTIVQTVPQCNVAPDNGTAFGQVYMNMNASSIGQVPHINLESFYTALGLFSIALENWFPCFCKASDAQK
ncbi:hypothetical protein ANO11243_072350 [Dothideomycetidae sp. 11243]|nr:hypothetical protein ANO11243_072350 [fungal sp. No.11243]